MSFKEVTIGPCRLICADCIDVLPMLAGVDAVVTDPPYGLELGHSNNQRQDSTHLCKQSYSGFADTYEEFVGGIVPRLNMAIDIADRAAVFTGPHINEQRKAVAVGGVFVPCATGRTPWGSKQFLPILLYGNPSRLAGCHRPTVLTSTEAAEKNGHPCPKPLSWMLWCVEFASEATNTILDPFMGSGTTGVACIRTDRKFIGIEREEKYFDIAVKRIQQAWDLKCSELPFDEPTQFIQKTFLEVE